MFNVESVVALKKSKSLSFVSEEKFLKSEALESNDENIMKSNDRNSLSSWKGEWKYMFFEWFFMQKYSEKKFACLLDEESIHFRYSEKQVLLKRKKAAIKRCSENSNDP